MMQIREFHWSDTPRIIEMIDHVWHLDQMFGNKTNGMIFSQEYFYDVLNHSTQVFVSFHEQELTGFIALNIQGHDYLTIPQQYQDMLDHQHSDFHKINSYRQKIKEYHQDCSSLLQQVHQKYDAEIVLFIVDEKYQHQGIGTRMYTFSEDILKEQGCQNYMLYTDSMCSFSFYDHHQMKLLASYQKEKDFIMYLYEKEL